MIDPMVWALSAAHPELRPAWLQAEMLAAVIVQLPPPPPMRERQSQPAPPPTLPPPPPRQVWEGPQIEVRAKLPKLLAEVAAKHNLSPHALKSHSRNSRLCAARFEFAYRAATETTLSYPQIGRAINRDHTSIIHAIRAYCKRNGLVTPRGLPPDKCQYVKGSGRGGRRYERT